MKWKVSSERIGRIIIGTMLGGAAACGVMALRIGRAQASDDATTPAQRQIYTQWVNQHYDLREVIAQFPRSRDAHRELGFSLYQQHKDDGARVEYETLQTIDPDDLAAHYILSIVTAGSG